MATTRAGAFPRSIAIAIAFAWSTALSLGLGYGSAQADVAAVTGSAYGYTCTVVAFSPCAPKGAPKVGWTRNCFALTLLKSSSGFGWVSLPKP